MAENIYFGKKPTSDKPKDDITETKKQKQPVFYISPEQFTSFANDTQTEEVAETHTDGVADVQTTEKAIAAEQTIPPNSTDISFSKKTHSPKTPENIHFANDKKQIPEGQTDIITERIEPDLLHRIPTHSPYTNIDMEDDFGKSEEYRAASHELTDKQREKRKKQRTKKAKRQLRKSERKNSVTLSIIKKLLCVLLAVTILIAGSAGYVLSGYTPIPRPANEYVPENTLLHSDSVFNLLLIGIDTNDTHASSRSDSMILLSADPGNRCITLTSFMRDMYVDIPGHNAAKLNAACTYGGPQLVCDTVEYNFGIKIDGYIKVGYEILTALVDGIGGITVPEVDATEAAALADEGYNAPIGTDIKMNGFEVLQYCRIRHGQDDFYRTARQREVILQIAAKTVRTNPVKLILLSRKLLNMTECSISKTQMAELMLKVLPCLIAPMQSARIPADGTWYNDTKNYQAVLMIDKTANTEYLKKIIYGKENRSS